MAYVKARFRTRTFKSQSLVFDCGKLAMMTGRLIRLQFFSFSPEHSELSRANLECSIPYPSRELAERHEFDFVPERDANACDAMCAPDCPQRLRTDREKRGQHKVSRPHFTQSIGRGTRLPLPPSPMAPDDE